MDNPLTKNELAWLITRLIGAVFLGLLVTFAAQLLAIPLFFGERGVRLSDGLAGFSVFLQFLFLAFGSYYFLRRGKAFHKLITFGKPVTNRPPELVDRSDDPAFSKWLNEDASRSYLSASEQSQSFERYRKNRGGT